MSGETMFAAVWIFVLVVAAGSKLVQWWTGEGS